MKLHSIETGYFKLDGGAMFGVVPKVIWHKINPADENNLCTWQMRCLLVEDGDKLILIDTGMGDKQSQKFFSYYYPHGDANLISSIKAAGFTPDEVTDVIFTHLHFDHCGGGIMLKNGKPEIVFKNATYWSNKEHWTSAVTPNARERASFLKENFMPLEANSQVSFIDLQHSPFENISFILVHGHTEAQLIPHIKYGDKTVVFTADLLPSVGHLPLPYIMGYDLNALQSLKEKTAFLETALANDYILFFEHDKYNECCTLKSTEKGARANDVFKLAELQ